MESKNLRIGNLVQSRVNGISRIEQIGSSINSKYIGGRSLEGQYWENSWLPIEITEKMLIDLGFKKTPISDDDGYYFSIELSDNKYCDLSILSGDKNGYIEVCLFPYESIFRYKYVHQLQNLYFALTGDELVLSES